MATLESRISSLATTIGADVKSVATGKTTGSKNGTVQAVTLWFGTEAQYNTATSNGTAEDANTVYFRT